MKYIKNYITSKLANIDNNISNFIKQKTSPKIVGLSNDAKQIIKDNPPPYNPKPNEELKNLSKTDEDYLNNNLKNHKDMFSYSIPTLQRSIDISKLKKEDPKYIEYKTDLVNMKNNYIAMKKQYDQNRNIIDHLEKNNRPKTEINPYINKNRELGFYLNSGGLDVIRKDKQAYNSLSNQLNGYGIGSPEVNIGTWRPNSLHSLGSETNYLLKSWINKFGKDDIINPEKDYNHFDLSDYDDKNITTNLNIK